MPCNMKTGDKNLDDPTIRQNLEDAANSAPADPQHPGYRDEVAGYCGTADCSVNPGDVNVSEPGNMRTGDVLEYHTHLNAGLPSLIPGQKNYIYVEDPSGQDKRSAAKRPVPSYVVGPNSIWRNTPDGKGGVTSKCFQRWSNSSSGCQ